MNQTYKKHINYFVRWLKAEHPDVKSLKHAKRYVNEWLTLRSNQTNAKGEPLSAWTIHTEAAALAKLFGISKDDVDRFKPPVRRRADIKRSRGDVVRDKDFSIKNNDQLIKFCRGTGVRRGILEKLKGQDYWPRARMEAEVEHLEKKKTHTGSLSKEELVRYHCLRDALKTFPEESDFLLHYRDKGGRSRFAPIIGPYKDQILERLRETPSEQKVFYHVNQHADIHAYRGDYSAFLYKKYARDTETLPRKEIYYCQKDEAGRHLDRAAMRLCSKALGHNRLDVISRSYLYDI